MLNKELSAVCLSIDRDRHRETEAERHVNTAQENILGLSRRLNFPVHNHSLAKHQHTTWTTEWGLLNSS